MRRERMLGYYPNAIKSILEFNAIIDAEYPELEAQSEKEEALDIELEQIIADAYLPTMSERRISQWEKIFGLIPSEQATLEDRRNAIIARIRGQGKLNTNVIKNIVKTFTGKSCDCWIENNTLFVRLLPFEESTIPTYDIILNITNELSRKIPAHLRLDVDLAYAHWYDVDLLCSDWGEVKRMYGTWDDVLYGRQGKANMLDSSKLDEFYLG